MDEASVEQWAVERFGRYKEIAPDLFVPNLLRVASDGLLMRVLSRQVREAERAVEGV